MATHDTRDPMTLSPERLVGRLRGTSDGPTLLALGGVHGNEPSGLSAMRRVLAWLERDRPAVRGEIVMLAGNLGALRRRERYIARDLNRGWTDAKLDALREDAHAHPGNGSAEDREQIELAAAIEHVLAGARGPVHVLDLHSTSAEGVPFAITTSREADVAFARHFPLPVVLDLLGAIAGTLSQYLSERGVVSLAVEGGQNASARSVHHHAATIAIALVAAGVLDEPAVPNLARDRALLEAARGDIPRMLRVWHRHAIAPGDRFLMEPGFANIARVEQGQLLARDRDGEIRAPEDGWVLMPLYQGLGDDGFFLGHEECV
jgi:succinylglutamate desuccinylase